MGKAKRTEDKVNVHFQPKTQQQSELYHKLGYNNLVVALGPAGTGKTFTSCAKVAQWFSKGQVQNIIMARANVPTGKSLGAIPGTLQEKLEPWTMPMTDALKDLMGKSLFEYGVSKGQIQSVALESIRGRSFEHSAILVDEAQQLTLDEIKAISTRVGQGSVLILMGDPKQTDLRNNTGLTQFINLVNKYDPDGVSIVEFDLDDIVRSDICAQMVRMFYNAGL
jgi:phosphate starvation-inducible PhoH-like protein